MGLHFPVFYFVFFDGAQSLRHSGEAIDKFAFAKFHGNNAPIDDLSFRFSFKETKQIHEIEFAAIVRIHDYELWHYEFDKLRRGVENLIGFSIIKAPYKRLWNAVMRKGVGFAIARRDFAAGGHWLK